jgi:hypothetical protein
VPPRNAGFGQAEGAASSAEQSTPVDASGSESSTATLEQESSTAEQSQPASASEPTPATDASTETDTASAAAAAAAPSPAETSERSDGSEKSAASKTSETSEDSEEQRTGLRVSSDRFSLDHEVGVGAVDGAWWPNTDEAPEAVPQLLKEFPEELGRVTRVALNTSDWSDDQPKTVPVDDRSVHLAWFSGMHRHTARVTFENDDPVVLLVLPPSTDEQAARHVLEAVGEERSRRDLLAEAGIEPEDDDVDTSAQDDQGGHDESAGAV